MRTEEPVLREVWKCGEAVPVHVYILAKDTYLLTEDAPGLYKRGGILVPNRELEAHTKKASKRTTHAYYKDVNALVRAGMHIDVSYRTERDDLQHAVFVLATEAMARLRELRKREDVDTRAETVKRLHKLTSWLEFVRNPDKVQARDQFMRAARPVDARGRRNPVVATTLAVAAVDALERRVQAVDGLKGFMAGRGAVFVSLMDGLYGFIRQAMEEVASVRQIIQDNKDVIEIIKAAGRLADLRAEIERIPVAPFCRRSFRHALHDLNTAWTEILCGNFAPAIISLDRLERSFRLILTVQIEVQEALTLVSLLAKEKTPHPGDVAKVKEALASLFNVCMEHQDIDRGFENPPMSHVILLITKALANLNGPEGSVPARKKMLAGLKATKQAADWL